MQYLWPQTFLYALFVMACNFFDSGHSPFGTSLWYDMVGMVPLGQQQFFSFLWSTGATLRLLALIPKVALVAKNG
jgi:hypothetical protein